MIDIGSIRGQVQDSRARFAARCFAIATRAAQLDRTRRALVLPETPTEVRVEPVDPDRIAHGVLVPGLLGDSVRRIVGPLQLARDDMQTIGLDVEVAWVNGRAGCDHNARLLRDIVLSAADRTGAPVHLIGYSKGCTDALHLLANHPETHPAIRSLTSLAGVVHGTPLAATPSRWDDRLLRWLPLPGPGIGDGLALEDLKPDARNTHLARHPLPNTIRYASIAAAPSAANVSRVLRHSYRRLSRIDAANDSQVIARDAVLPRGELLAVLDADHWAVALPIAARHPRIGRWLVTRNDCPRTVLLQALLEHLTLDEAQAADQS